MRKSLMAYIISLQFIYFPHSIAMKNQSNLTIQKNSISPIPRPALNSISGWNMNGKIFKWSIDEIFHYLVFGDINGLKDQKNKRQQIQLKHFILSSNIVSFYIDNENKFMIEYDNNLCTDNSSNIMSMACRLRINILLHFLKNEDQNLHMAIIPKILQEDHRKSSEILSGYNKIIDTLRKKEKIFIERKIEENRHTGISKLDLVKSISSHAIEAKKTLINNSPLFSCPIFVSPGREEFSVVFTFVYDEYYYLKRIYELEKIKNNLIFLENIGIHQSIKNINLRCIDFLELFVNQFDLRNDINYFFDFLLSLSFFDARTNKNAVKGKLKIFIKQHPEYQVTNFKNELNEKIIKDINYAYALLMLSITRLSNEQGLDKKNGQVNLKQTTVDMNQFLRRKLSKHLCNHNHFKSEDDFNELIDGATFIIDTPFCPEDFVKNIIDSILNLESQIIDVRTENVEKKLKQVFVFTIKLCKEIPSLKRMMFIRTYEERRISVCTTYCKLIIKPYLASYKLASIYPIAVPRDILDKTPSMPDETKVQESFIELLNGLNIFHFNNVNILKIFPFESEKK